jgi:4-hydroxy-tetrahydrodipicolinate synthase
MQRLRRPSWTMLAIALTWLNGCSSTPCRTASCPPPAPGPWSGIYPTVLTPYTCNDIDVESLEKQIHYQISGGVHGLVVLGSIGEGHRLNDRERGEVIATAVRAAGGSVPVIVGIHTCKVTEALAQMRQARNLGAKAVLVKYYGNPRAEADEVQAFYKVLSDANILPIFFYHYPSDTHLCLSPQTIAAILQLANVVGIKESTFNLREVEAHIRLTRGCGKTYLSGNALHLTQFLEIGGSGAMCPEAALLPCATVAAFNAWQMGDRGRARSLQLDLYNLVPVLSSRPTPVCIARAEMMTCLDLKIPVPLTGEPNPLELKYALTLLGVPTPVTARCPNQPLRSCDMRGIERAIERVAVSGAGCLDCERP